MLKTIYLHNFYFIFSATYFFSTEVTLKQTLITVRYPVVENNSYKEHFHTNSMVKTLQKPTFISNWTWILRKFNFQIISLCSLVKIISIPSFCLVIIAQMLGIRKPSYMVLRKLQSLNSCKKLLKHDLEERKY